MFRFLLPLSLCCVLVLLPSCTLAPKRVAVMDFEIAASDPRLDDLSISVPECFVTVMTSAEGIHMLERQDVNHYLSEIDRQPSLIRKFTRWQQLGKRLDVDYLIAGSVSRFGNAFVVQCRLFSVSTGQIIPGTARSRKCSAAEEIIEVVRVLAPQMAEQILRRSWHQ